MKIEINREEIQAFDALINDAKVPVKMGLILGLFRSKIQEELVKEQEKQLRDRYGDNSGQKKTHQKN